MLLKSLEKTSTPFRKFETPWYTCTGLWVPNKCVADHLHGRSRTEAPAERLGRTEVVKKEIEAANPCIEGLGYITTAPLLSWGPS